MDTLSEVFDALGESRRRHALYALADADGPLDIETLAERIAEREDDRSDADGDRVDRIRLTLVHNHLPKLVDAGVIEYDSADETAAFAVANDSLRDILAIARDLDATE